MRNEKCLGIRGIIYDVEVVNDKVICKKTTTNTHALLGQDGDVVKIGKKLWKLSLVENKDSSIKKIEFKKCA